MLVSLDSLDKKIVRVFWEPSFLLDLYMVLIYCTSLGYICAWHYQIYPAICVYMYIFIYARLYFNCSVCQKHLYIHCDIHASRRLRRCYCTVYVAFQQCTVQRTNVLWNPWSKSHSNSLYFHFTWGLSKGDSGCVVCTATSHCE